MRVIAGEAGGLTLKAPRGSETRPTSDRVRESLFGLLENLPLRWTSVLDLYAGSGALGIEALSRGAERADFVESRPAACTVIRENLKHTGLLHRGRVVCRRVEAALREAQSSYDIILADPPYQSVDPGRLLAMVAVSVVLAQGSAVVLEHSRHRPVNVSGTNLALVQQRRYGETAISIYLAGEEP